VVRSYLVHPHRLAFAQGGLYLLAYVPDYKDVRTFAVERIAKVSIEKHTFTPAANQADDVFANSLGVNSGPAALVEVEFAPRVAPYVRARVWHPSQQLRESPDGTLVLSMNVCHDWALRSWILGWGPFARVRSPKSLVRDVRRDLKDASNRYAQGE
jgi:proteasome accessory factor B